MRRKVIWSTAYLLLGLAVFAAAGLSIAAHYVPVFQTDVKISEELQESNSPALFYLMRGISFLGDPLIAAISVIIAAIFLIAIQYQREALFMLLTSIGDLVGHIVKFIVNRPRPSDLYVSIYREASGSSFPSGHVVHFVLFFGFLFVLMFVVVKIPRTIRIIVGALSLGLIILISISRIYLGAHWASDVIGGYLVGFVLLSILLQIYFRITRKV